MSAPWEKNPVTPEAERLVARASAANHLAKLERESTWLDRLKVSGFLWVFVLLVLSLPLLGIWALFELLGK